MSRINIYVFYIINIICLDYDSFKHKYYFYLCIYYYIDWFSYKIENLGLRQR